MRENEKYHPITEVFCLNKGELDNVKVEVDIDYDIYIPTIKNEVLFHLGLLSKKKRVLREKNNL